MVEDSPEFPSAPRAVPRAVPQTQDVRFSAGSVLGDYRMEAPVGEGGMAWVFRARHLRLNRLVALKILKPTLAADLEFQRRFVAEAQAASAVDDPHIIPVYEAGEAGGLLFIAMRFVPGGDLSGLLEREGALSPARAAAFVSPVASALDAAHAAGFVHRDIKPANILVDAGPGRPDHVYLSDFGVSKAAMSAVSLTGVGVFVGSPSYSAPEQFDDRPVDGRADQYALACVAYQLLTGEIPFGQDTFLSVMTAHLSSPPPSLGAKRPGFPQAADHVLARALAKAPGDRFGSCGEFAEALREALGLLPYNARTLPAAPAGPADPASLVETVDLAAVSPRPPTQPVVPGPRTLPRDIASFTGRQLELDSLVGVAEGAGGVVGIHAIGGMAGVGKTAFAVHAAHRLAPRFPDGQIFLQLHGHTPGQRPVGPADALASLLLAAGVPAGRIPPGVAERMALWRDRTAEKQLLLILDDAEGSEQVRPLLPGAGGSLVLVTSRRHLSALEDATSISLDTLPPDEAAALLVRLANRPGLSPADPAVEDVTRLCGYLPLAIGMVARQLHHHPAWSLIGQAADLMAARDRLELMTTESVSVAAAFNLSYEDLAPGQQQLFRRLGLHPGADIDAYAAAALAGTDLGAARRGLDALYDHYLLTEPARGRYRLHDLLREHARALVGRLDTAADRDGALAGLLDYYQQASLLAEARLARQARPASAPAAASAAPTEPTAPTAQADSARAAPVPVTAVLGDRPQALAWARSERANLLACLDHAAATGQTSRVIALTAGLASLLRQDGPWADAIAAQTAAARAAQRIGDRGAQANALSDLGIVSRLVSDFPGATKALAEALAIFREIDDKPGQANALNHLGKARQMTDDLPGATRDLEEALAISRAVDDRLGQAAALTNLGSLRRLITDYPGATRDLEEALSICRETGDRLGELAGLLYLAEVRVAAGDHQRAAQDLEQGLVIARETGNRLGTANAFLLLGDVRKASGDNPAAIGSMEAALGLYRELGDRLGQGNSFLGLGEVRRLAGDYPGAARDLAEGADIFRAIGNRGGETAIINQTGALHLVLGALDEARSCHRQALEMARQIGEDWDEAHALAGLGRCDLAAGRAAEAAALLERAREIFERIGASEAIGLAAELAAVRAGEPSSESE